MAKTSLTIGTSFLALSLLFSPLTVFAQAFCGNGICDVGETSGSCPADCGAGAGVGTSALPTVALSQARVIQLLNVFVDWIFAILVVIAVIALLIGAYNFITAGANAAKLEAGKNWLLWALVGFGIALLAKGMLMLVCNLLGVTPCPGL